MSRDAGMLSGFLDLEETNEIERDLFPDWVFKGQIEPTIDLFCCPVLLLISVLVDGERWCSPRRT